MTEPTDSGVPIRPWTETAEEFMVQERFPHLRKRLEEGLDCLDPTEREELHRLARLRADELQQRAEEPPLHGKVSLITGGNLVHVAADAIVNASNQWLSTGKGSCVDHACRYIMPICMGVYRTGVNGAIHAAAGPGLLNECLALGGCGVGQAKITSGHNLPARYVIHTVGPEAREENRRELLRYVDDTAYTQCAYMMYRTGHATSLVWNSACSAASALSHSVAYQQECIATLPWRQPMLP